MLINSALIILKYDSIKTYHVGLENFFCVTDIRRISNCGAKPVMIIDFLDGFDNFDLPNLNLTASAASQTKDSKFEAIFAPNFLLLSIYGWISRWIQRFSNSNE